MVTLKEINLAINTKLKSAFPTVTIQSTDIKEGFSRPCFYVEFDNSNKSPFMSTGIERNVHVIIYYFPSNRDKYKLEILDTQAKLEDAFSYIFTVKDGFIVYLNDLSGEVVDGILQFSFDVMYIEQLENDEALDYMEDLNLNI